ncbi:MAG: DNA polymerase III subunit gamma/tau [Firmicutes bacterium]|nr:DNA polymerase III subunit gamma/tau [Bacillota bacterium]
MTQKEQQYIALYRRWRPQTFGEVVGQEHVTRTLQNALRMGRVAHAYLFCGLRGTGKTTMAKLLAKSINCLEPAPEGYAFPVEPCNKCLSCQDINRGRSMDVLEIDAASNRGIDEIRDLREKVRFAPAQSRYKVYIIDEVHMLTNEAFNALLKTLEEPPGKVIFILATTEASRLPATVISRCQRFDFHLLEAKEISDRLQEVAGRMGFSIDKDGLSLLANMAEGSLRDALGLLEQCASYADGAIGAEQIQSIFGIAAPVNLYQLMEAVHKEDLAQGFTIIKDIVYSGKEPGQFLKDLSSYVRLLLLQEGGGAQELIEQEAPFLASFIRKHKGVFLKESLLEMLEITSDVDRQLRSVTRPQFLLELCFLRLVRAHRFGPYLASGELFKKLEELEAKGFIKGEHTKGEHNKGGNTAATPPALPASASSDLTSALQWEVEKKAAPAGPNLTGERLKDTWEEKILPDLKRKHITV